MSFVLSKFLMLLTSQDVFILILNPCIEQGGSILLGMLLCDICDGLAIFKLNERSVHTSPTISQNLVEFGC